MITSKDQSVSRGYSNALPTIIAWIVTLSVSSLIDIVWFEIKGTVPIWLLWIKITFLGVLILLSWFNKHLKSLRTFFIMLLAITSLMRLNTWI